MNNRNRKPQPAIALNPSTDVPFSQEAEEATIGSVLINPNIFTTLTALLKSEDFMLLRHQAIWQAFARLTNAGETLDLLLVKEDLEAHGKLDEIGGISYLVQLSNNTPSALRAEAYARLVQRTSVRRKLMLAADKMNRLAVDETTLLENVLDDSRALLEDLIELDAKNKIEIKMLSELTHDYVVSVAESMHLYQQNPQYMTGISSGLNDLDEMIDGFEKGTITTIVGGTGMGKSSVVMSIALNAARAGNKLGKHPEPSNVILFSGEMTDMQLMNRIVGMESNIPNRNIKRGAITPQDQEKISNAIRAINQLPMGLVSVKSLSPYDITQIVAKRVRQGKLDLLILDGLNQIDAFKIPEGREKEYNQYQEGKRRDAIEMIMRKLETLATTYNIPIILTHQINRAPDARANKRPQLGDISEASFVAHTSASVIGCYWDMYYNTDTEHPNLMELIALKGRFTGKGKVDVYFDDKQAKVKNATKHHYTLSHSNGTFDPKNI